MDIFCCFLAVFILVHSILDLLFFIYYSRKCKYNCDECRYWPCNFNNCKYKRNKKINK